jgi:hypothetical protein
VENFKRFILSFLLILAITAVHSAKAADVGCKSLQDSTWKGQLSNTAGQPIPVTVTIGVMKTIYHFGNQYTYTFPGTINHMPLFITSCTEEYPLNGDSQDVQIVHLAFGYHGSVPHKGAFLQIPAFDNAALPDHFFNLHGILDKDTINSGILIRQ